jgi:EpsI family protein
MQISSRKYLTVIIILSITLMPLVYIDKSRGAFLNSNFKFAGLPLEIGEWKGKDVALPERTYKILETRDVIVREYSNPQGEVIALAIVRSANERSAFHPPEICYLGGGVELLDKTVETVDFGGPYQLKANKLVMQGKGHLEVAWYWFTVGDEFTHNYYIQQCRFILNELIRRRENDGALIRISTPVIDGDLSQADKRVKNFISNVARFFNS